MLTVAPGGNNLATICYKDFLGLATINMYYYYYYYYYHGQKLYGQLRKMVLSLTPQAMYNPIQKTILVPSPQCGFCFQAVFKF